MLIAKYMGIFFLFYFTRNSEGFGIPDPLSYEKALEKLKEDSSSMKTVYLDFDKTFTVNGYSEVVRNDYCQAKYSKCIDFDASDDQVLVTTLKERKSYNKELVESFGGEERLEAIKSFLGKLRQSKAAVKIVSTSWYPITAKQWQEYLYYVTQQLKLGFEKNEVLTVLDPGPGKSADKGAKIQTDAEVDKSDLKQAIFADDSWGNIKSARNITNTLYLNQRKGLDPQDRNYIIASVNNG